MIHRWWQLAIRNWRARFTRTLFSSFAVIVACALVVGLMAAFASGERTLWRWHERWVGKVHVTISARRRQWISQSVVDAISAVPTVRTVASRLTDRVQLVAPGGRLSVRLKASQLPEDLLLHRQDVLAGRPLSRPDAMEIVIEQAAAEQLGIGVGDTVQLRIYDESWDFAVVGITPRPPLLSFIPQTVYVPLRVAQGVLDRPGQVDRVYVRFDEGVDLDEGIVRIRDALGEGFEFHRSADTASILRKNLPLWRANVYMFSSLLLAMAMLLVFATLACDVTRRTTELGTLRCVGASRRQLAGLVMIESLPIAIWGAVVGVPLGLLGSWLLTNSGLAVFSEGWAVSGSGIALAVAGSTAATLGGAALPAILAARMTPVQARRIGGRGPRRWVWAVTLPAAAVLLAAPMLHICAADEADEAIRGYVLWGQAALTCGIFLAAPLILLAMAGPVGRLAGWALRVHPSLVGRHVLRTRWRSAAVGTALALCVSLVVSAHTQAESILASVKLPTGFPDLLMILPTGVRHQEADHAFRELGVTQWTGLNAFDIEMIRLPEAQQSKLTQTMTHWRSGNTWYLALDVAKIPAVKRLDFVQGSADEAIRRLAEGDTIIVSAAFARRRGSNLGDKVSVRDQHRRIVQLEVVGVVATMSIEAAGSVYDFSELCVENVALTVMGSSATAAKRFNQHDYSVLLVDVDSPAAGDEIAQRLRAHWRDRPVEHLSLSRLKEQIVSDFRRLTLVFTLVGGLLAAAVASVGVANAMQAGVYSRRRELGVLHAVGMTRGQLARLILGEALVVGLAGAVLGVAAGLYGVRMGAVVHELRTGVPLAFVVPFGALAVTVAVAVGATIIASIAAAARAGRANVIDLMKE